jgi:hypothetical protein
VSAKRTKFGPGDIFEVDLGDGFRSYGIVAAGNDHAFFDLRSRQTPPLEEILSKKVIFRVPVSKEPFASGKWRRLGNVPLLAELREPAAYRNQPVGSNQVFRYQSGRLTPSSVEEVKDLELLAVWLEQHIVDRLNDHFAGKRNRWVEYFKTIRRYDPKTGQEVKPS